MAAEFEAGTPLYQQLARHLLHDIRAGTYPVGGLLPTEAALAEAFGVSRATVRQAIAELRNRKLLSARKGVGTRVEPPHDEAQGRFSANSRSDLDDVARGTEWRLERHETLAVRGALATELGVRPGRRFAHVEGPRHHAGSDRALCWDEVYADPRMLAVLRPVTVLRQAVFLLIEQHLGERVREIRQEIRPVPVPDAIAASLRQAPGSLCIRVDRRYLGSGNRLLEFGRQHYPAEGFVHRSILSSD